MSSSAAAIRPATEHFLPRALSWTVWAVAASYYLAAFYLRSSPAVMTNELMRDFHISAGQLGTFSAVYFYAYIAMQIPTGERSHEVCVREHEPVFDGAQGSAP